VSESKHVAAFRGKHLKVGEEVVASGDGYIGEMMGKGKDTQHNGVLIVSRERVAFYRKGFLGEVLETIPLKSITSIERKSMLGHRTIRIDTSHDSLEFKTFDGAVEQSLVDAIEANRYGVTEKPQAASSLDTLKKLAELRDAGVITEEEFAEKKRKILSSV
jgi:Short C-terminal domain/Bacterial PH domain